MGSDEIVRVIWHKIAVFGGRGLVLATSLWLGGCASSAQGNVPFSTREVPSASNQPAAVVEMLTPSQITQETSPTPTPGPTFTPSPSPTPPEWRTIARGISQVYLPVPTPGSSEPSYFYVLRIDPAEVTFKVIYDPKEPHLIDQWQSITRAPIVFNGGFFTGSNKPNGRIVSDGVLYGSPLNYGDDSIGIPGLLAVTGHRVEVYALGRSSYNPGGLRFDQAVEAYPLLLLPGGQPTFPQDTLKRARRTVIGLDQANRVVVIISDIPLYSLYQLSEWLATSNLGLDTALNLDGGRSTGIMVTLQDESKLIDSIVPVPVVIGIYPGS